MFLWGREVLSIIKSLSRAQKRNIMLFVDAMLVPLALMFSFSLHASDSGAVGMMLAYLPVLVVDDLVDAGRLLRALRSALAGRSRP